ncbi:MAG TPA: hypothetical protein VK826_16075 [Bacteroidia bacterium]|nr:hypothetical protein [Bacteroidia bacterium]
MTRSILFLLLGLYLFTDQANAQVGPQISLVRYAPFLPPTRLEMPPQYGVEVGYGITRFGKKSFPFFGATFSVFPAVTDTFTAPAINRGWGPNQIEVSGKRKTRCFGFFIPFYLNIYNSEFFCLYGGLDIGAYFGASFYSYDGGAYTDFEVGSDYPAEGKTKIRGFPGGMQLGALYEMEKISPFVQVGFVYSGLTDIPGVNAAWYTLKVGVQLHFKRDQSERPDIREIEEPGRGDE